jgi:hypothetical protein
MDQTFINKSTVDGLIETAVMRKCAKCDWAESVYY